ncbi:hypothetical protein CHUAL_008492 [Chamberlinius hualienensis]
MSVGPIIIEIVCTFCVAATLLYKYGNWAKHHVAVTISVLIAWYFSFIIIFILPLDISSTAYMQCVNEHSSSQTTLSPISSTKTYDNDTEHTPNYNYTVTTNQPSSLESTTTATNYIPSDSNICNRPWSYIPNHVLPILWRIVYWTSQCLTWLILPMMQSYSQAGDFTVVGKLRSALIDNAIYYGTYLLIFVVLLVYIAASPNLDLDGQKLKVICVTTSNTWGLTLLVLLLGYGLVEVPRTCWNSAKRGFMLNYIYFKASKLNVEKSEAEDNVEDILEDLQRIADNVRMSHPLRKFVDTILTKVPESHQSFIKSRQKASSDDLGGDIPSERSLVRLHKQLIRALRIYHRTQTQWSLLIDKAISLEDITRNEVSSDRYFKPSFQKLQPLWWRSVYTPTFEWYWKCVVQVWALKICAVVLTVFSIFVVWSEVTFFNRSPVLSIFAIFLELARDRYAYFYIEFVSCLIIFYLCVCAYYTIFKIRVLNYYYLAPHHQTDEYSLIFSGMLLCRLTPPMCLNFLGMVHLDSHVTSGPNVVETSYTMIMGHMDVISFISDGFNIYFPMGVLILCLATYFKLGSRILHFVGFQQFIGDDDMTAESMEEGRELIKREKRKMQRNEEGESRRRHYQEKLSGTAMYRTPKQNERTPEERSKYF